MKTEHSPDHNGATLVGSGRVRQHRPTTGGVMKKNADYEEGLIVGRIRRKDQTYDVRYDMARAAKRGEQAFADFKRGLEAGMSE